eukprot:m.175794 g.175794  ORF g.175794 m.175794 type:complete len:212 (-) comp25298_c0_seq64:46-681(-)
MLQRPHTQEARPACSYFQHSGWWRPVWFAVCSAPKARSNCDVASLLSWSEFRGSEDHSRARLFPCYSWPNHHDDAHPYIHNTQGGQISVCKDHDPSKGSDQLFLSPSFRYANFVKELAKDREGKKQVLAPYAKPFAFEGKYYLVSLQILVRPGTFDIIPHSLGKFEFPRNYDPPLSNNELEYCTRTQNGHSLQGVCITSLETLFQQNKRKG